MSITISFLRWSDVDPDLRSFDPAPARAIAGELVRAAAARVEPDAWRTIDVDAREALSDAIDRALIAEYGPWAAGWCWAASEPGGGGPVRGWCCPRDSLFRDDDPDVSASATRVVDALIEWRAFLVELAAVFRELRDEGAGRALEDLVERAAARLLPRIVERTSAEDAWYATFGRVVGWYLETLGHRGPAVLAAIREVVRGHFSSWIAPSDDQARDACAELGLAAAAAATTRTPRPDALAVWLRTRADAFEHEPGERDPEPVVRDGHLRFIEGRERARDPARAERMAAALAACRAAARRGEPLTFAALSTWQALVLGIDAAPFRTTDAFAKDGRERYGIADDTPQRFAACLAESEPGPASVAVRAARVYLDVCFFHPFADGNARAARLALDHVVTRAGLALHAVEPLFVVARGADDPRGAWCLAYQLASLLGAPA